MDNYKETFETWNKVALLYQSRFMDLDLYNDSYDFMCNSITHNYAKILEIGCGPGNITKYLLSKRPDFEVFGIDIAPNMITLAKKNNPAAKFAVLDSRNLDKINTKYHGIVCGFCLPYLSQTDCKKLISDCYNLLNKEGLLYISFVEDLPNKSGFQVTATGDRVYFNYFTLNDLSTQLVENKFGILKVFDVAFERSEIEKEMHKILIAKKDAR